MSNAPQRGSTVARLGASTDPSSSASAVQDGKKLLDSFRREKRSFSLERGRVSGEREVRRRPRAQSESRPSRGVSSESVREVGARCPVIGAKESDGGRTAYQAAAHEGAALGSAREGHGSRSFVDAEGASGVVGGKRPRGGRKSSPVPPQVVRGHSLPPMGAPRDGEARGAQEAQEAQVPKLLDRLRVSAETLCRTQAELGSMTSELDAERRGRDEAESQLSDLKEQVANHKRNAEAQFEDNRALRSKLEALEPLASKLDDTSGETDRLRLSLQDIAERLLETQSRLRKLEEIRAQEAESSKASLEAARKHSDDAQEKASARHRELSSQVDGLHKLLAEQDTLLADREVRLSEERAKRSAQGLELRELRSREADRIRELSDRAEEIKELNQLLAQLQEGDTLATVPLGAMRPPGAEKEALQTRLDEMLTKCSVLEKRAADAEERASIAEVEVAEAVRDAEQRLQVVNGEKCQLQELLTAVEARVSEGVQNRADLSRRLAERAFEAEEAQARNQDQQSLSNAWARESKGNSRLDLDLSAISLSSAREVAAGEAPPKEPSSPGDRDLVIADLKRQLEDLRSQLAAAEERAGTTAGGLFVEERHESEGANVTVISEATTLGGLPDAAPQEREVASDRRGENGGSPTALATRVDDAEQRAQTAEQSLQGAVLEQERLRGSLAEVRGELAAVNAEFSAVKDQLSSAVASAQVQLAREVERASVLEKELTTLRSMKQDKIHLSASSTTETSTSDPLPESESVDESSRLSEMESELRLLRSSAEKHAEDLQQALGRASKAEKHLAEAQNEIAALSETVRTLESKLDEGAAVPQRGESQTKATVGDEASGAQIDLKKRLEDAEIRARTLGKKLEDALNLKQARDVRTEDEVIPQRFKVRDLEDRLDALHEELAAARTKAAQASQRSASSAAELAKSHAEAAELRARWSTSEKQLTSALDSAEGLRASGRELGHRLDQVEARAKDSEAREQEALRECKELSASASRLQEQIAALEAANTICREKESRAVEEQRTLSWRANELSSVVDQTGDELAKAREQISDARAEALRAREEATAAIDAARAAAAEDVSAAQERARKASEQAAESEEQAKVARAEAGDTAAKLSAARVKAGAAEADLKAVRSWAEAGSERASASMAAVQRRLLEMTKRAEMAEAALGAIRSDLEERMSALEAIKAQLKSEKEAREAAREEIDGLTSQLRGVTEAAQDNERKANEAEENLEVSESLANEANTRVKAAEQEVETLRAAVVESQKRENVAADQAAADATRLENDIRVLKDELARAQASLSEQRESAAARIAKQAEALELAEQAARQAESTARASVAAEIERLESALAEADMSYAEARGAAQATEDVLRASLESVDQEVISRSEALRSAEEARISAERCYETERTEAAKLRVELAEVRTSYAEVVARKEMEAKNVEEEATKLHELLAQAQICESTLREAETAASARANEAACEATRLQVEIAERDQELERARKALADVRTKAAAEGAAQAEELERVEEAARQAEAAAHSAVASDLGRLEAARSEAEAGAEKVRIAAEATETALRSELGVMQQELSSRSEEMIASEEARGLAETRVKEIEERARQDLELETSRASEFRAKLDEVSREKEDLQQKMEGELAELEKGVRAAEERERAVLTQAASEAARYESEISEVKNELEQSQVTMSQDLESAAARSAVQIKTLEQEVVEAKKALSVHRATVASREATQAEVLERTEEAAREAESAARAAVTGEVKRLEEALLQAEVEAIEVRTIAKATEDTLRSELQAAERELTSRFEALESADEARRAAELVRDEARAEKERVIAELNSCLNAVEAQARSDAQESAERHAEAVTKASADLATLQRRLDEAETRERVALTELKLSKESVRVAEAHAAELEASLDRMTNEVGLMQASLSAHRTSAASQGSVQAKALVHVEEAARQAAEQAREAAAAEVRRLQAALTEAETLCQDLREMVEVTKTELTSRLSATEAALALSKTKVNGLASELAISVSAADRLRSRLASVEAAAQERAEQFVERSEAARDTAKKTEDDLRHALQGAKASSEEQRKKTQSLREEVALLGAQVAAAKRARVVAEEESKRVCDNLRAELLEAERRTYRLLAERDEAEARLATVRGAAGTELERTSAELESSREAESISADLAEANGRAAAVARATLVEAERKRDEAQAALQPALEASLLFEDELNAQREEGERYSSVVVGLTKEIKEVVKAGVEAAAEAMEEREALLLLTAESIKAARAEGAAVAEAKYQGNESTQQLDEALPMKQPSSVLSREVTEALQMDEGEDRLIRYMAAEEKGRRGSALLDAEATMLGEQAESKAEGSFVMLEKRDIEREAVERLRDAEQELSAARRMLREAGAERELLRNRLEESRQETEDLLKGLSQDDLQPQSPSQGSLLPEREAFLRERDLREKVEMQCAQMQAALDEQLEQDAQALERMEALTREAREERVATDRERERLQGTVDELERGRHMTEETLHATQQELDEARMELEDLSERLARHEQQLSAVRVQLVDAKEALENAKGDRLHARQALENVQDELRAVREELADERRALGMMKVEFDAAKSELEVARNDLHSTKHELSCCRQAAGFELDAVRGQLMTAEEELAALREEFNRATIEQAPREMRLGGPDLGNEGVNCDLQSEVESTKERLSSLQDVLARTETLLRRTESEHASAVTEIASVRKEYSVAERQLATANEKLEMAEKEQKASDQKLRELEVLRNAAEEARTAAEISLEAKVSALQRDLAVAEADAADARRDVGRLWEKLRPLGMPRADGFARKEEQKGRASGGVDLEALLTDVEEFRECRRALVAARSEVAGERKKYEARLAMVEDEKRQAEASAALHRAEVDSMRHRLAHESDRRSVAEAMVTDVTQRLTESQAEATVRGFEVEHAKEQKGELDKEREARGRLERELKAVVESKATLEQRLSSLEDDLVAARKLAVESTDRADALKVANRSLTREVESHEASAAAASAEAARLEYEVAEAEASAVGFKEQLKEAVRRLETSAGEAETARRVAKEAEKALAESSSKVIEAQAKATSLCQERQLLESRLNELLEKRDEVSHREDSGEAERRRLEHNLQETRAMLDATKDSVASAAAAEREAAARAGRERAARESAEDALCAAESRVESLESESLDLKEEVKHLGVQVEEASRVERVLRGFVEKAEQGRSAAECVGEAARKEVIAIRLELLESTKQSDERESERRELAEQVNALKHEVQSARERERRSGEQISDLRGKATKAEEQAGSDSSEAERLKRSLRSELHEKDARIVELEAQAKALTVMHERLSGAREALLSDSFRAQDLLRTASERLRRLRRIPREGGGGFAQYLSASTDEFKLPRGLSRRPRAAHPSAGFEGREIASRDRDGWTGGGDLSPGTRAAGRAGVGSADSRPRLSPNVRASLPTLRDHREGVASPGRSLAPHKDGDIGGMGAEVGIRDPEVDGPVSAAMDVLREVERMQAAAWELELHEKMLQARLEDQGEALSSSEGARKAAEQRARAASEEAERLAAKAVDLEKVKGEQERRLEEAEAEVGTLGQRSERAELLVSELKAKVRGVQEEARRLRGQLEATGLSDTAMMGLLKAKDAALAAAGARTCALESAKKELEERTEQAEGQLRQAEELAESLQGQLEGRGSFDRRLKTRLERCEEELEHLRVQATEADAAAEAIRTELNNTTAEAEALATELHDSEQAVAARDELLRAAREASEMAREQLVRVQEEAQAIARRAEEAEACTAAEHAVVVQLRTELDDTTVKLNGALKEITEMQVLVAEKSRREESLEQEAAAKAGQIFEMEGAMTGLSEEVRRTQAALGGTEDRLQQNTALLEKARGVAEALRVQMAAEEKSRAEAEEVAAAAAQAAANEAAKRIASGVAEIESLKEEARKSAEASVTAEEMKAAVDARLKLLEHKLDSKAHEADALQARLTSTESDETELRKTVGELQARLEDLEQENTGLQAQIASKEACLEQERSRARELERVLDASVKEKFSVREALTETKTELVMVKETLVKAQSAFEAEQSGFSAAREQLATTRERLRRLQEDDLAVAVSDLAVARGEARAIAAVRDSLEKRLGEESRTIRTIEETLSVARREAEVAQNEVVGLKKEAEAREAKASVDLTEVMAAKEESSAVAKKSEEERDAAQGEVKALMARLLEARAGREASEEALDVARGESSSLSKQLHAAGKEALAQQGLLSKVSTEKERLQQQLVTSEETLASVESELVACRASLASQTSALATAQDAASAARLDAKKVASAVEREGATREAALRAELETLRSMTDGRQRGLEIELAAVREQFEAASKSVAKMKRAVEAAETGAAETVMIIKQKGAEDRAKATATLESLRTELRSARERESLASASATSATKVAAEKEIWANKAVATAEAAAEVAASKAAEEAEERLEIARVEAHAEALQHAKAEQEERDRRMKKMAAGKLHMLSVGLHHLLTHLRDSLAAMKPLEWSGTGSSSLTADQSGGKEMSTGTVGEIAESQDSRSANADGDVTRGVCWLESSGLEAGAGQAEPEGGEEKHDGDESGDRGDRVEGMAGDDVGCLVKVVKEASSLVSMLREALDLTVQEASEASRALELNRAEALHLRSHNAVLEETLAEVSAAISKNDYLGSVTDDHGDVTDDHGDGDGDGGADGDGESAGRRHGDPGDTGAEADSPARTEALKRTNRHLELLLRSIILGRPVDRGRDEHGHYASPSGSWSSPRLRSRGVRRHGAQRMTRSCSPLPRPTRAGCGERKTKTGMHSEEPGEDTEPGCVRYAREGVLSSIPKWRWPGGVRWRENDQFGEEDDTVGLSSQGSSLMAHSSSSLARALRSLVSAVQDRETRVAALEAEVSHVRGAGRKEVEAKGARLETLSAECASLRAELQSLRSVYEVGNAERRKLEARLVTLVQQSEDASLSAAAEAESLRKALGESKEEVHAVSEQQHQYQAEAEVALSTGQECLDTLESALEHAAHAAHGVLSRMERAAYEAEGGKVEVLQAELRLLERSRPEVSMAVTRSRSGSVDGVGTRRLGSRRGKYPVVPSASDRPRQPRSQSPLSRASWPPPTVQSTSSRRDSIFGDTSRSTWSRAAAGDVRRGRTEAFQGYSRGDAGRKDVRSEGRALSVEAKAHAATAEVEEVCWATEAVFLRQAVARASDVRDAFLKREVVGKEAARSSPAMAMEQESRRRRGSVRREGGAEATGKRMDVLEAQAAQARRDAAERLAELELLRTQRETLVRRAETAEAEAARVRATSVRASSREASSPKGLRDEAKSVESVGTTRAAAEALEEALKIARSELVTARRELAGARREVGLLRARLQKSERDQEAMVAEKVAQARARAQAEAEAAAKTDEVVRAGELTTKELRAAKRELAEAERRAEDLDARRRGLEKKLEIAERCARLNKQENQDLNSRLEREGRRRQVLESTLQESGAANAGRREESDASGTAIDSPLLTLRSDVARARARIRVLEKLLDETTKDNSRLELEVAQEAELGARAKAELGAALAGERLQRDDELTEIKSVVDELIKVDASASGGGVAGRGGLLSPRRGVASDMGVLDGGAGTGTGGPVGALAMNKKLLGTNAGAGSGSGAGASLTEAWSLVEVSEAARRKLQDEVRVWADKVARLEEALSAAEAAVEESAREARLLLASLQDTRRGLAHEEAARKQAEDRAEALRVMLETRDCGSGGGASPGGSAAGGEASRNLADQVKALRSRVDELLERAKDAEDREAREKYQRKAAQRALNDYVSGEGRRSSLPSATTASTSTLGSVSGGRQRGMPRRGDPRDLGRTSISSISPRASLDSNANASRQDSMVGARACESSCDPSGDVAGRRSYYGGGDPEKREKHRVSGSAAIRSSTRSTSSTSSDEGSFRA